jgi:hypothetical protein
MTDLLKLLKLARENENTPQAKDYIEPLCYAIESLQTEIKTLQGPVIQVDNARESFKKEENKESVADHPFDLLDKCQQCGGTIKAHATSVWLLSIKKTRIEALEWALKTFLGSPYSWIERKLIREEIDRLKENA